MEPNVKSWHGISRETIAWNPTVDEKKCIGCGICVTGCGRKVYGFDYERKKPVVLRPSMHGGVRDLREYLPAGCDKLSDGGEPRELLEKEKALAGQWRIERAEQK